MATPAKTTCAIQYQAWGTSVPLTFMREIPATADIRQMPSVIKRCERRKCLRGTRAPHRAGQRRAVQPIGQAGS
jgi:hypothetical protein